MDRLVLVEDIISAIACGRVVQAVSVLGSPGSVPSQLYGTLSTKKEVIVWLDYDKRLESIQWAKQIAQNLGIRTRPVWTKKDPKCYTKEEIAQILGI